MRVKFTPDLGLTQLSSCASRLKEASCAPLRQVFPVGRQYVLANAINGRKRVNH